MFWGSKKRVKAHILRQVSVIRGCTEMATPEEEQAIEREDREGRKGGRTASNGTTQSGIKAIKQKKHSVAADHSPYAEQLVSHPAQQLASAQPRLIGRGVGRVKLKATLPRGAVVGDGNWRVSMAGMHKLPLPGLEVSVAFLGALTARSHVVFFLPSGP